MGFFLDGVLVSRGLSTLHIKLLCLLGLQIALDIVRQVDASELLDLSVDDLVWKLAEAKDVDYSSILQEVVHQQCLSP